MEKKKRKTGRAHASVKWTDMEGVHLSWCGVGFLDGTILDLIVIQGNLIGVRCRDEILQQQVEPFMQNHPEVEMFQHDNTRPHTARVCTAFLANAGIDVMDCKAKSPDINPVESVWGDCSVIRLRSKTTPQGTCKNWLLLFRRSGKPSHREHHDSLQFHEEKMFEVCAEQGWTYRVLSL